jgi:uncharacterized protein (DUF1015 family)
MRIHPFKGMVPDFKQIALSPDLFCDRAKDDYQTYVSDGRIIASGTPAYYAYQITKNGLTHIGVVTLTNVHDMLDGNIKKHEKTLAVREDQYFDLLQMWRAVLKPVLLAYTDHQQTITNWLVDFARTHEPYLTTTFEQSSEVHQIWAIADQSDQAVLEHYLKQVQAAYIADGHHRTTTISKMYQEGTSSSSELDFSGIFSAYFASNQLRILGYHRVVTLPEGRTETEFIDDLRRIATLRPKSKPVLPTRVGSLTVVLQDGTAYELVWSQHDPQALDVDLLNERILRDLAGILDVRTDKRVRYVEGAAGIEGVLALLAKKETASIGFLLPPVRFEAVAAISDQGATLPPKSTWFEPRLKSGWLVQPLAKDADDESK